MTEPKKKLNLKLPVALIARAREMNIPINQLVNRTLERAVKGEESDPVDLVAETLEDKEQKHQIRTEERARRAERFWKEVQLRRHVARWRRYENVASIIKEREESKGIVHDEVIGSLSMDPLDGVPEIDYEDESDGVKRQLSDFDEEEYY